MNLWLLAGAIGVSIAAYRLVAARTTVQARQSPRPRAIVALLWVLVVGAVPMVAVSSVDAQTGRTAATAVATARASVDPAPGSALPSIVAAVKAAERGAAIPANPNPALSVLQQDVWEPAFGCAPGSDDETKSPSICSLGDASAARSIVVFGDSHAKMWMPTILAMAKADGWRVTPLVKSGCVPSLWAGTGYPGTASVWLDRCHAWYRWAVAEARALHPDVVLVGGCCGGAGGSTLTATKNAFANLAGALRHSSKSVIVVADDDGIAKDPNDCLPAPQATLKACLTTWTKDRYALNDQLAVLAKAHRFGFLKTRGWFCSGYSCPMVVGNTVVYRDTGDITQVYARRLMPMFETAFRRCIASSCPA